MKRWLLGWVLAAALGSPAVALAEDPPPGQGKPPATAPPQGGGKEAKPEPFVDRDGDGIQDGKERRFRKGRRQHRPQDDQRRQRRQERRGGGGGAGGAGGSGLRGR